VAVNLSPRQLREADLVETVADTLASSGLPAHRLSLEITEAVLVDDSPTIADLLRRLKSLGVRISIDDFGTGYSSLSYLRRLPIDTLKIDRSFVSELAGNAGDAAIIGAIAAMARELGIKVVAEGVETEAQLEILRGMHCAEYQGHLTSHALPPAEFEARFLANA
jgi:EAL domain-containing protein (putative c-di-GMP-specific phosphodiesterase class I)